MRQNTLIFSEQQAISRAVKRLSIIYPNLSPHAKRKYFTTLYKALKQQFQVLSYKDIQEVHLLKHWQLLIVGNRQNW